MTRTPKQDIAACRAFALQLADRGVATTLNDAADQIERAIAERDAYRTIAINAGWNWRLCNAYGREEYQRQCEAAVDAKLANLLAAAPVGTLPKGQDGEAGLVRSKGDAVIGSEADEQAPNSSFPGEKASFPGTKPLKTRLDSPSSPTSDPTT